MYVDSHKYIRVGLDTVIVPKDDWEDLRAKRDELEALFIEHQENKKIQTNLKEQFNFFREKMEHYHA